MTCRLGGTLPQMRGHWRRRRIEPAAVTQLLFVRLAPGPDGEAADAAATPPKPESPADQPGL